MRGALLLLLLLPGCLGENAGDQDPPGPSGGVTGIQVRIQNFSFDPPDLSILAGETVVWTNLDDVDHWIIAEGGGGFDSGRLPPEATFTQSFKKQGQHPYRCGIHPGMGGSVQVT